MKTDIYQLGIKKSNITTLLNPLPSLDSFTLAAYSSCTLVKRESIRTKVKTMSDTDKSRRIKDLDAFLEESLREKQPEEVKEFYESWANTYDEEVSLFNYNGPKLMAKEFAKLNVPKNVEVIDIAAGTGALGEELKALGYTCIDALDGTKGMLEVARKKNIYRNLFQFLFGCDDKSPITNVNKRLAEFQS